MNSFGDDSNPFAAANPRPPASSSVFVIQSISLHTNLTILFLFSSV